MMLIDADDLRQAMYHEAFETYTDLQKWDSGCWIRYKLFEKVLEAMPLAQPDVYKLVPISEALPQEEGEYFVTDDAGGLAKVYLDIFSHYEDGEPYWMFSQNVTAWMHTPEPYKEGEKNE